MTGWPAVTWEQTGAVVKLLRGEQQGILHLHGFWSEPRSVVLGIRDYQRVLGAGTAQHVQRVLPTLNGLLYIGCGAGLDDPNFSALRAWIRDSLPGTTHRHVRLARDGEVDFLKKEHDLSERTFLLNFGPNFDDLSPFLKKLASDASATTVAGAARLPLQLLISYSHKDKRFSDFLRQHLVPLQLSGIVNVWHDRDIGAGAGEDWPRAISAAMNDSDIILALVSADYLASDYIWGKEMETALRRHERREATVIPIIIRPCRWRSTPLAKLQALPRDARPVTDWPSIDSALDDVVEGIEKACQDVLELPRYSAPPSLTRPLDLQPLYDVFKQSGLPTITFVEPERYFHLKLALKHPGRGVIIEGPSGIGKTTALKHALDSIHRDSIRMISARQPTDVDAIKKLPNWHHGIVVIDDFHRLPKSLQDDLGDYVKYLADSEKKERKLVLIGIPTTGQRLVALSHDLATRIEIFKLGRVTDDIIHAMIHKGEVALNISFARKSEIVRAAAGSLNIAQTLCYHLCVIDQIDSTQRQQRKITTDVDLAVVLAMESMSLKFSDFVRNFASVGGASDLTCIELLKEFPSAPEGVLSLEHLKTARMDLRNGIDSVITNKLLDALYKKYPESNVHVYYDDVTRCLVADDPQFLFYLSRLSADRLLQISGKRRPVVRNSVFVSYCHADAEWLGRILVHLKPLEREGKIDVWADTRIKPGERWREEVDNALERTKIGILVVSADFLASDFIANHELPAILAKARREGARMLSVIVRPCLFKESELSVYQAVNDPDKPLESLSKSQSDGVLANLAREILQTV